MRTPEEIESLLDKVESLLGQFDEANDRFDRGEWNKKYGERLGPYCDKLKLLNGDNFDLMKESFDEYHKDYSDVSDDDYVDHLEDNIKKVIEHIWPSAPEEVKDEAAAEIAKATEGEGAADGAVTETHIETEDKNGDGEIQPDEVETHTVSEDELESDSNAKTRYEKRSASNKSKLAGWDPQKRLGSDEEIKEEPKEADPMAEFQKSLDEEYAKMHK